MWGGFGARLRLGVSGSPAIELFGESPSRLVLSCRPRHAPSIELLARQFGLAARNLGTVGGDRLRIDLAGQGATGAAEERGSRVADALDVAVAICATRGITALLAHWRGSLDRGAIRRQPRAPPWPRRRSHVRHLRRGDSGHGCRGR